MKKVKFKQEKTKKGSRYTDWIFPLNDDYHMACCDCGLVHTIKFRTAVYRTNKDGKTFTAYELPKDFFRVKMKVSRNNKLTKEQRKEQ